MNNVLNSGNTLDSIKIKESLAQYIIVANVKGSERDSHINIVAAYYNYWKVVVINANFVNESVFIMPKNTGT